jgi:hypothetical protein
MRCLDGIQVDTDPVADVGSGTKLSLKVPIGGRVQKVVRDDRILWESMAGCTKVRKTK